MIRVLFIDDEQDLIDFLPGLLSSQSDLEVVGMSSIEDALHTFNEQSFDVVLLDIMMPPTETMNAEELDFGRKTGIEVIRRIRKRNSTVPIIAFTVLNDAESKAEIVKAGATSILLKPSDTSRIIAELRQTASVSR